MNFTEMLSSALARIVAFLPNLLAALLILAVGLFIASVLARVTRKALKAIELHRRRPVRTVVENEEMLAHVPSVAGRIVYWSLAIITIGLAVNALQLAWLSAGVARVVAYLPNVLAAAVILVGAYLLGNYLYRRMSDRDVEMGAERTAPRVGPGLVRASIFVIAAFMALQELGIATTIVTSAFIIGLGAIAIAATIAFGLGSRELAGRITSDWYDRRQSEREEAQRISAEQPPPIVHH